MQTPTQLEGSEAAFSAARGVSTVMDFEAKVLPRIGGYGPYNKAVAAFSWIPCFAVAESLLSEVFLTLLPRSYRCRLDPVLLPAGISSFNLSEKQLLNVSIPQTRKQGFSHCELYKYPANFSRFGEDLPNETVPCTEGWEFSLSAGLRSSIVTQWNLVCQNYWKIPLQHIFFMIGWIFGYLILGLACDRVGRRSTFLLSVVLSGMLGVAVSFSMNPDVFLMLRLFQGAALAGVFLAAYVARLEVCDPPHRLMVTMIGGLFAFGGELLLPGLAVVCVDWQVLQAIVTVPLLLLISYWWCNSIFPESPRWLLATCQIRKARSTLQIFSSRNGVRMSEEIFAHESFLSEFNTAYSDSYLPHFHNICEMIHVRVVGKNCLILGFTAFIGTGIQYCFTRNLRSFQADFYFSYFLRCISGGLACFLLCISVNRFGRRGILLLSSILTGMASLLLLALTQYLKDGVVLLLSLIGLLASHAMAMLSIFFASEVLPTVIRGAGLGLILAVACIGKATSSLMDLKDTHGYFLHHVVFASFAVLSVLCIMLLPESKRKPLPDSLKDGESLHRPPLFLSKREQDDLPLLHSHPKSTSDYNSDSYSSLVSATKKMLGSNGHPFEPMVPPAPPHLKKNEEQHGIENAALSEDLP
ncbi:putative solute carrier family 22 member 31 [Erpetoichthys calabaricus]|uniref:putative solute carrier family 22 member 31 n=1 Tax=Erpetoichthys calabaricus TaxID=27687 RepID=UPI0022343C88|nr:putative solute carrier family 22 member 31 [Erpetoichthys calabaricus]